MFAVRGLGDDYQLGNLPELTLSRLDDRDARVLLASAVHGRLDAQVGDRIVTETRGNPLALLELPAGWARPNWREVSGFPIPGR